MVFYFEIISPGQMLDNSWMLFPSQISNNSNWFIHINVFNEIVLNINSCLLV